MAHRREAFQSKVLQKLYPKVSKQEKEPSPPNTVETLAKKPYVKSKAFQSDGVKAQNALPAGRRVYTVLPPPADYKTGAEGSVTVPQPESINIAEDPAEESGHENSGESTEVDEKRRRRKRKKRKPTSNERSVQDVAPQVSGSSTAPASTSQNHNPAGEGGEGLTRNKRRKLKKKRHKEKLLSLGLVPRAAALEFTYQREGGKGEEEKRAAEVSEFLRTTMEIYLSDCSVHADKPPVLSLAIEGLLSSIACGNGPPSVLRELHSLKSLVVQKDPDRLAKALEELHNTASMSPDETTSVASLFQYWITDILPMQRDVATGPFT